MHVSWVVLQMLKPHQERMLTTWWPWAQSRGFLSTDHVNPGDTTLFSHVAYLPLPHLAFENALPKPSAELRVFLDHESPSSFHGPSINLSLLQTPPFRFVWPHCALGTWTCTNKFPSQNRDGTRSSWVSWLAPCRPSHNGNSWLSITGWSLGGPVTPGNAYLIHFY